MNTVMDDNKVRRGMVGSMHIVISPIMVLVVRRDRGTREGIGMLLEAKGLSWCFSRLFSLFRQVLTLVSNERVPLSDAMRMVFEINSLKNATPATVSRAGILFINETGEHTSWSVHLQVPRTLVIEINVLLFLTKWSVACRACCSRAPAILLSCSLTGTLQTSDGSLSWSRGRPPARTPTNAKFCHPSLRSMWKLHGRSCGRGSKRSRLCAFLTRYSGRQAHLYTMICNIKLGLWF